MRRLFCFILLGLASAWPGAPRAAAIEPLEQAVCRLIDGAARAHGLPVGYLTRIIWKESSFRAGAVSPKGAEGIAQFMPGTAAERGLANPFDPEQAIPHAARFLAELKRRFGNLGMAAAAYNAGPGRVEQFVAGRGGLPAETRAYVAAVTDAAPEAWLGGTLPAAPEQSCPDAVAEARRHDGDTAPSGIWAPWGVQLAGNFSKAIALASFERARQSYAGVIGNMRPMIIGRVLRSRGTKKFYQVRLPAATRQAAQTLCGRIRAAGGICLALPS